MYVKVRPSTTLRIVFTLLPGINVILGTFPKAFPQLCQHPNGIFLSDNLPLRNFPSGNFQIYPGRSARPLAHPSCSAWSPLLPVVPQKP